jgi:pyridoxal phosphate-dependent aminotransferase EpsN
MKPLEDRLYLSAPHVSEGSKRYVDEAFASNWLSTTGPNLQALERMTKELFDQPTVAVSSGTAAIHLALRLLNVQPGDQVVTPSLSFVASTNPIRYVGAEPVFIDSEWETWNLDPNLLETFLKERAAANRLPKAVIVVHLFGQPAAIHEILELCRQYDIPLIEDAAESLGALYHGHHPGTFGDAGVVSFNGNKMITGTTGGLLMTRSESEAEKTRKWSQQSLDPDPEGVKNYVHSELGYNYRMSNVVAGIVRGQLEVLDDRVQARRSVFARYAEGLKEVPGLKPQREAKECRHSRWLSCFTIEENLFGMSCYDLIRYLANHNVESRPIWRPMHLQPLYQNCEMIGGSVAAALNRNGICLPSSSSLALGDQQYVVDLIHAASNNR